MKNLKYIFGVSLVALSFASCQNYFDEKQIHNDFKPTDVRSFEYELKLDDYKTLVGMAKNIAIAKAACTSEDSLEYEAFKRIADDKAFNDLATADMYVPAFIYSQHQWLSMGSLCNVIYRTKEADPAYFAEYTDIQEYTLTEADYQTAWGSEERYVNYLTPATISQMNAVLKNTLDDEQAGAKYVINYNYQELEPVFGAVEEEEKGDEKKTLLDIIAAYDGGELAENDSVEVSGYIVNMFLKPTNFAKYGSVSIWLNDTANGVAKQFELYNCYGINGDTLATFGPDYNTTGTSNIDVETITSRDGSTFKLGDYITAKGKIKFYNGTYELNTGCYLTAIVASTPTAPRRVAAKVGANNAIYAFDGNKWALPSIAGVKDVVVMPKQVSASQAAKYLSVNYPYAVLDDTYALISNDGKAWSLAQYTFDGMNWNLFDGIVTESMSFVLNEEWLANLSVYYQQAIMGEGLGNLFIQNVSLGEGITYVWTYAAQYGMKGTSYASGAHEADAWVVTPAIKLKNSKQPALNFDQAINYGPTDETRAQEMSVLVSTNFDGDVTTADWKVLPWNAFDAEKNIGFPDANSWTFYNSGDMDLSEYNGKTIYIAFRYKAEAGWTCSTWEFKNLLVHEAEEVK